MAERVLYRKKEKNQQQNKEGKHTHKTKQNQNNGGIREKGQPRIRNHPTNARGKINHQQQTGGVAQEDAG